MNGSKNSKITVMFLIACAVILAVVPVCWMFFRGPEFLALEKRYRGKWPEFNADMLSSGDWGRQVETWATDNMPARELLVGVDAYSQLITGRQFAQKAFVDRDGRLLEAPPPYSEEELAKRLDKFIEFSELLDQDVLLVIPPTAGYTSKASLPEHVWRCYNDDALAGAIKQQAAERSSSEGGAGSALALVDLREAFLNAREPLFYRTDHHWNGMGAYTAYTAICEELGLEPLPADAYAKSTNKGFYGSNYAISGLWLTRPDEIEMWAPPCEVRVSFTKPDATTDESATVYDSMFFTEHLSERDQYPVFLDSNQPLTFIKNMSGDDSDTGNGNGAGVLFIIKDSYANSLMPLLIPHFDQIVAVDLRYFRTPVSELAAEIGLSSQESPILVVYSAEHIVNDPNILWLR